jgi:hypothetical protein
VQYIHSNNTDVAQGEFVLLFDIYTALGESDLTQAKVAD